MFTDISEKHTASIFSLVFCYNKIHSSETSANIYQTTYHIPEDSNFHAADNISTLHKLAEFTSLHIV
jgi:hypothetical protein